MFRDGNFQVVFVRSMWCIKPDIICETAALECSGWVLHTIYRLFRVYNECFQGPGKQIVGCLGWDWCQ